MPERILLVDLENMQTIDSSRVPHDARIKIFYGMTQKNFPLNWSRKPSRLGLGWSGSRYRARVRTPSISTSRSIWGSNSRVAPILRA